LQILPLTSTHTAQPADNQQLSLLSTLNPRHKGTGPLPQKTEGRFNSYSNRAKRPYNLPATIVEEDISRDTDLSQPGSFPIGKELEKPTRI